MDASIQFRRGEENNHRRQREEPEWGGGWEKGKRIRYGGTGEKIKLLKITILW